MLGDPFLEERCVFLVLKGSLPPGSGKGWHIPWPVRDGQPFAVTAAAMGRRH